MASGYPLLDVDEQHGDAAATAKSDKSCPEGHIW